MVRLRMCSTPQPDVPNVWMPAVRSVLAAAAMERL